MFSGSWNTLDGSKSLNPTPSFFVETLVMFFFPNFLLISWSTSQVVVTGCLESCTIKSATILRLVTLARLIYRYLVTLSTFKEFHLKVWHALRSITSWIFIICSHPAEITKIDPESESSHFMSFLGIPRVVQVEKPVRSHCELVFVDWLDKGFRIIWQIIATSHDLTPKGSQGREMPLFQGNLGYLGWWNIVIWPDIILFGNFAVSPLLLNTNDLVVFFLPIGAFNPYFKW